MANVARICTLTCNTAKGARVVFLINRIQAPLGKILQDLGFAISDTFRCDLQLCGAGFSQVGESVFEFTKLLSTRENSYFYTPSLFARIDNISSAHRIT